MFSEIASILLLTPLVPVVFEEEICQNFDKLKVCEVLHAEQWLKKPNNGRWQHQRKYNGASARFYVLMGEAPPDIDEWPRDSPPWPIQAGFFAPITSGKSFDTPSNQQQAPNSRKLGLFSPCPINPYPNGKTRLQRNYAPFSPWPKKKQIGGESRVFGTIRA